MNHLPSSDPRRNFDGGPVIDLIPGGLASPDGRGLGRFGPFARFVALAFLGLLGILFLATLARIGGLFWVRSEISESTGEIAAVSGFDGRTTDWLKGTVSFVASMLVAGSVFQLLLGFVVPGLKGPRLVRSGIFILAATGFFAVAPGIVGGLRGVDGKGLPVEMREVDAATAVWFTPDNAALIFYADHLDGQRRYWNRPGHTPMDAALAHPVNQEARRSWEEKERRTAIEAGRMLEEASATSRANDSANTESASPATAPILVVPASSQPPVNFSNEIPEIRVNSVDEWLASYGRQEHDSGPLFPNTSKTSGGADNDAEIAMMPGRILEVTLGGGAVEVSADGTVELSEPGKNASLVLGRGSRRRLNDITVLYVRPVDSGVSTFRLRWIGAKAGRPAPAFRHLIPASVPTASAEDAPVPTPIIPTRMPSARPAPWIPQSIPLQVGRTAEVRILGDAVECWADGPVFVGADSAPGSLEELAPQQRLRVSGASTLFVAPCAVETRTFHIVRLGGIGAR